MTEIDFLALGCAVSAVVAAASYVYTGTANSAVRKQARLLRDRADDDSPASSGAEGLALY